MNGKFSAFFILIPFLFTELPANAMLRVLKYQPLTQVKDRSICVFSKHEHNPKRENLTAKLNGKSNIVCRLTVAALSKSKRGGRNYTIPKQASNYQEFRFGELTKTCIDFSKTLSKNESLSAMAGMQSECTLAEASRRVFPDRKISQKKKA